MLASSRKSRLQLVRQLAGSCAALPGAYLLVAWQYGNLGPNPLETLLHTSGRSALVLLALTLAITPLRRLASAMSRMARLGSGKRLADWNWLIPLRRTLGLWCFAYAMLHAWPYLALDIGGDWALCWSELREKPYLGVGALALAFLVPLAATSNPWMMRYLGRTWQRLHMLTYAVAVLGLLHFWWLVKPGDWGPLPDTLVLGMLLGYRLMLATGIAERWQGHDGSATPERGASAPAPGPLRRAAAEPTSSSIDCMRKLSP